MSDSYMRSCTTVPYVGLQRMLDEEGMLGVSVVSTASTWTRTELG